MSSVPVHRLSSAPPQQQCPPLHPPPRFRTGHKSFDVQSTAKKHKSSLDIAQRFERKLAEYNASQNILKRWLFEVLSWCISAVCMAAIVGIYFHLKDKPIGGYMSGYLLTMANVFGKIASAALIVPTSEALGQLKWKWFHESNAMWDFEIFDKASRGPWGAVMLLFRTRCRSLAALGAFLIVLLLAIDTFFQQVVSLPTRWTLEGTAGTLPSTIQYDPHLPLLYREGGQMSVKDKDMSLIIETFSYENGTQPVSFGNGTRPEIPLSCPTSNCTWPVYDTLGVCSQCEDVSTELTYACLNTTVDWTIDREGGYRVELGYPNATMCGYFLNATSQDPTMMSGYLVNSNGTLGETLLMRTLPLSTLFDYTPLYGNGSIKFKHYRNTITDVLIVSAANGSAETVRRGIRPTAHECVLNWCVKTMRSSYYSGRYSEEVLHNFQNTTKGLHPWVTIPFWTENDNGTDLFYVQNISIDPGMTPQGRNITGFGVSNFSASSIITGFSDIFPAVYTLTGNSDPIMRYKFWNTGPASTRVLEFNPWLAPNNVTRHMERLATAMTNVVRSSRNRNMISGDAFTRETFISISWAWLSFPFTLLILGLVFLVATMMKTSNDGELGSWKTSAMPALIYSLPQDVRRDLASSTEENTPRKSARKVRIRLHPDQGWRVSGQRFGSPTLLSRDEHHATSV
ncbi:hypothetical protein HBI59_025880 [Parastagonospora nodorum]|nr:hypothetical protein HBI59_025880 [Parastagonospora nodorum]